MIEFADSLDRLLQFLVIAQPAAHLINALAPHAELARASARVGHSQDKHLMPFAARAFRAIFAVPDRTLQQRAAQQLASDRQLADQLLARADGLLQNYLQKNESDDAPTVNFNSVRSCSFPPVSRFCAWTQRAQFCAGK
jgi:hypothetical protein